MMDFSFIVRRTGFLIVAIIFITAVSVSLSGTSPFQAINALMEGAFGNPQAVGASLNRSVPLILGGLAVTLPFRAGAFNLGVEGQLYVGAIAAAWIGAQPDIPPAIHLFLVLATGALTGALWAAIAAMLKLWFRVHELLSTLLLNYIALSLTSYLAGGPLKAEDMAAATRLIAPAARMDGFGQLGLHGGIVLAIMAALGIYIFLHNMQAGHVVSVTGDNATAARIGGMRPELTRAVVLIVGGSLAGLAGAVEVAATHYRFFEGFAPGLGFDGITAALIGVCAPLGTLIGGLALGFLKNGALTMDIFTQVPREAISIVQAVLIILITSRRLGLVRRELRISMGDP